MSLPWSAAAGERPVVLRAGCTSRVGEQALAHAMSCTPALWIRTRQNQAGGPWGAPSREMQVSVEKRFKGVML